MGSDEWLIIKLRNYRKIDTYCEVLVGECETPGVSHSPVPSTHGRISRG